MRTIPKESKINKKDIWEQRWHPLLEEWVVIASHRNSRPSITRNENIGDEITKEFDFSCHLCPGNTRASGEKNLNYQHSFIAQSNYKDLLT